MPKNKYKMRANLIPTENGMYKPERQFPFVHSIETHSTGRIYTFYPSAKTRFEITAKLPLQDYGDAAIEVTGKELNPHILKAAIDFVVENETRFSESFDLSQDEMPRVKTNDFEIGEESFQKMAQTV